MSLPLAYARWALYRLGLRGYCFPHDVQRWRWTHRNCCAQQRASLAHLLDDLGPDWRR